MSKEYSSLKKCLIFVFQQTSEKRGHIESWVKPNKPASKQQLTDSPRLRKNLSSSSQQKVQYCCPLRGKS